jgi:hypothetical protein
MMPIGKPVAEIRQALKPPLLDDEHFLESVTQIIGIAKLRLNAGIVSEADLRQKRKAYAKAYALVGKRKDCAPIVAKFLKVNADDRRASPNVDPFGRLCVSLAIMTVERFSTQEPVATADGNVHIISKAISRAAGRKPSRDAFLNFIRKEIARRKHK